MSLFKLASDRADQLQSRVDQLEAEWRAYSAENTRLIDLNSSLWRKIDAADRRHRLLVSLLARTRALLSEKQLLRYRPSLTIASLAHDIDVALRIDDPK